MNITHGVHGVILDLGQLELDLVPVDGLHREVGRVGDDVVVGRDPVHEDVEPGGHLRADHHTEGGGELLRLTPVLSARIEDQVLGDDDPVKIFQGEVALHMEHYILANIDVLVAAVDENVLVC